MEFPSKPAPADFPILDAIRHRWSPVIFSGQKVEDEKISRMFEAARWTQSSFNEQPWRFLYATKEDGEDRANLEGLLVESNAWAKDAGVLLVTFAKKTFAKNGKENRHCMYDAGAATGFLFLQLHDLGLIGHSMAGFDWKGANEALGVPDDYLAASMTAIGYPGDASKAPEAMRQRDQSPRMRNPQSSFVFKGHWPKA
jgi:nitroreductase